MKRIQGIRAGRTSAAGMAAADHRPRHRPPAEQPLDALPRQHGTVVVLVTLVDEPDAEQRYQQRQQGHRLADESVHVGTAEQ